MAPEQRDTPNDVDHRADIYSLGVVFYELLTGELPRERFAPPSAKSDADPRVDAIVQQALEKERSRRQHSAGEVKTQVESMAQTPRSAAPTTPASGDLFLGLLSLAAVVSTAVGTWISWKSFGTASQTFIGLGEPWLVEGVFRYETGIQHATNLIGSAWCVSAVAMMLATVFWLTWFCLKCAKSQRLDSFLCREGNDHIIRVGATWIAATAASLWAFFFVTGLYMAFSNKVLRDINPEVPVTAIYILALAVGFGWTLWRTINFGRLSANNAQTPGPAPAPTNSMANPLLAIVLLVLAIAVPTAGLMIHNRSIQLLSAEKQASIALHQREFMAASEQIDDANGNAGRAASRAGNSALPDDVRAQAREEQQLHEQRAKQAREKLAQLNAKFAETKAAQVEAKPWRAVLILLTMLPFAITGVALLARGGRAKVAAIVGATMLVGGLAIFASMPFVERKRSQIPASTQSDLRGARHASDQSGTESWSYTPRYLTEAKFVEWAESGEGRTMRNGAKIHRSSTRRASSRSPVRASACDCSRRCCACWISPR